MLLGTDVQLSPNQEIVIEGPVCFLSYVKSYLISYDNIYFCEPAIYYAAIYVAPILR